MVEIFTKNNIQTKINTMSAKHRKNYNISSIYSDSKHLDNKNEFKYVQTIGEIVF